MRIRTFRALRPDPDKVTAIASLPYDVVKTEEARSLAEGNPLSFLRVVRAEIDFPKGQSPYADEVYAKAVENLQNLRAQGHLKQDGEPGLYVYQQRMGTHVQQGLVAVCHVEDYEQNRIKKHEKTRPDKENDRTRLTSELSANSGPVFLTYRDEAQINQLVAKAVQGEALYDFTAVDGIQHTAWKVDAPQAVVQAFANVQCFYVADGHHRSASAARVGKERRLANPNHTGEEDYNWFLCVLFPASHLKVLPYNRIVQHLNGYSAQQFLEAVGRVCPVCKVEHESPATSGRVCMYLDGSWYELNFEKEVVTSPVDALDVSHLQRLILAPLLGVDDPRTAEHIEFAGGIRGTSYLKKTVDSGEAAVAFSMAPVTIEQLMAISDADEIMPPKSTWFEPKLRSGLFLHTFESFKGGN